MTPSILAKIKECGCRLTPLRRSLSTLFEEASAPVSAPDIVGRLKQGRPSLNKTSVYRELDSLVEAGIIQEVDLGEGVKRYERAGHHHHLLCERCKAVTCVEAGEVEAAIHAWEASLSRRYGFTVASHALQSSGTCAACAAT